MLREGEGLYLLSKNVTLKGENYVNVLHGHLLPFLEICGCHTFMHDRAHLVEAVLTAQGNMPNANLHLLFTLQLSINSFLLPHELRVSFS